MDAVLVRSTYASKEEAQASGRRLVEGGLAACVHVTPIASTYRWQGEVQEDEEWLLEVRTTASYRDAVAEALAARHPYEVPLVESWEVRVAPAYGAWMRQVTTPP